MIRYWLSSIRYIIIMHFQFSSLLLKSTALQSASDIIWQINAVFVLLLRLNVAKKSMVHSLTHYPIESYIRNRLTAWEREDCLL